MLAKQLKRVEEVALISICGPLRTKPTLSIIFCNFDYILGNLDHCVGGTKHPVELSRNNNSHFDKFVTGAKLFVIVDIRVNF